MDITKLKKIIFERMVYELNLEEGMLKTILDLINCFHKTYRKELDVDKIVSRSIEDLVENTVDMGSSMLLYIGYRILEEILGDNLSKLKFQ